MYKNTKLDEFNKEIENKKIAIIGLGISNMPLVDYFYNHKAIVSIFDNRTKEDLDDDIIKKIDKYKMDYYGGEDNLKYLVGFDYIFRSPSCMPNIVEIQKEVNRGAILTSEIEKVIELTPSKVIGVTGSDGKTTTTTLIHEILSKNGYNCFLGGNIGTPLFDKIENMKPEDIVVLELSSFQLMNMKISPDISVITNISPNHLNVHKDYEEYIESKKNIFLHQKEDGLLVINYDNEITKEFYKDAKGRVKYFSSNQILDNGIIFDREEKLIKKCEDGVRKHLIKQKNMKLRGIHNCENACAAIAATEEITKEDLTCSAIENFAGVKHRIEYVKSIDNIPWYNDSIGTSPSRTIAGLNSFDEKIVLIAGGYDKHLDYAPIAEPILKNVSKLVLMGQTADKIEEAVKKEEDSQNKELPIYRCKTLEEAVLKAKEISKEGEVVLFSPASASFDLFKNFEERGNKFKELVESL